VPPSTPIRPSRFIRLLTLAAALALGTLLAAVPAASAQTPCIPPLCIPSPTAPGANQTPATARPAPLHAPGFDPIYYLTYPPPSPCRAPRVRTRGMEIAIQDEAIWMYFSYFGLSRAARMRAYKAAYDLGVRWMRLNIYWGTFVKYNGFVLWDDAIKEAAAAGIRTQITLAPTPEWDRNTDRRLNYLRPNIGLAGLFARGAAKHFRGCVTRYSAGNEVNLARFLSPTRQAPTIYRNLYRAMYNGIKGVDRKAQVLIGELTSAHNPLGFLTKVANVRGGLRADGLAFHPFQFFTEPGRRVTNRRDRNFVGIARIPEIKRTLATLARRRLLRTSNNRALPMYFTEFAYLSRGTYQMPESRRRRWALKAFQLARRQGARQMLWYMLVNPPRGFQVGDRWESGILTTAGRPLPTYTALRRARRSFAGF
jgi:hypothetical protein